MVTVAVIKFRLSEFCNFQSFIIFFDFLCCERTMLLVFNFMFHGFDFNQTFVVPFVQSGADLGFSRGGGRIFKKFSKILTTFFFFRSTKLIFRALPKHCFAPILAKFSAPQANFSKNSQKSRFWALFEKF